MIYLGPYVNNLFLRINIAWATGLDTTQRQKLSCHMDSVGKDGWAEEWTKHADRYWTLRRREDLGKNKRIAGRMT